MISLPCTQCQRVLSIDEAFAGGVCRCQHCGTIQTVPAHLKDHPPDKPGPSGKTLYKHPRTGESHVGTGLANLQEDGTTPGPIEKRPRAPRALAPAGPDQAAPTPTRPWTLYAALAGVVVAGLVLIWLLLAYG